MSTGFNAESTRRELGTAIWNNTWEIIRSAPPGMHFPWVRESFPGADSVSFTNPNGQEITATTDTTTAPSPVVVSFGIGSDGVRGVEKGFYYSQSHLVTPDGDVQATRTRKRTVFSPSQSPGRLLYETQHMDLHLEDLAYRAMVVFTQGEPGSRRNGLVFSPEVEDMSGWDADTSKVERAIDRSSPDKKLPPIVGAQSVIDELTELALANGGNDVTIQYFLPA